MVHKDFLPATSPLCMANAHLPKPNRPPLCREANFKGYWRPKEGITPWTPAVSQTLQANPSCSHGATVVNQKNLTLRGPCPVSEPKWQQQVSW